MKLYLLCVVTLVALHICSAWFVSSGQGRRPPPRGQRRPPQRGSGWPRGGQGGRGQGGFGPGQRGQGGQGRFGPGQGGQGGQGGFGPGGGGQGGRGGPWSSGVVQGVSGGQTGGGWLTYKIVDTAENKCYDFSRQIRCPSRGQRFHGQDAQYKGYQPSYRVADGTVFDQNTGLTWQQVPSPTKLSMNAAKAEAASLRLGGFSDWRIPNIKELFSLINFNGDIGRSASTTTPFIDTNYFTVRFGDTSVERFMDAQILTTSIYVGRAMGRNSPFCFFGVNFLDGRIKCYPLQRGRSDKTYYRHYVRGPRTYGLNAFQNNGDQTITDSATGLMWTQGDTGDFRAGQGRNGQVTWEEALKWAEDLNFAGHSDWRLPNVKELQSIVDYGRSPDTTSSPALNPIFSATVFTNEGGQRDWGYYWSSTTHVQNGSGDKGAYVCFGRCMGYFDCPNRSNKRWCDVHGAGAQRSDNKFSNRNFPQGFGPQGDAIRMKNFARAVRNAF